MLLGFFISAVVFYVLNVISPVPDMDQMDSVDVYGTFTAAEARRIGVAPLEEDSSAFGITGIPVEPNLSEKGATGEKRV
jgi:NCS1 family nucleobase:cation symporter-1